MANLNLSQFGENTSVSDADYTFVWDSAVSISKKVSRNSWLNSGTLTSSAPVTISQTWNNAAVAFTGLRFNAAGTSDANSAAASKLLDLQIGGVSKFSVDKYGIATAAVAFRQTPTGAGINVSANGSRLTLHSNNATVAYLDGVNFVFDASAILAWSSSAASSGTFDTALLRDGAANTLALRNGAAAQTFNVYGTYTSGTIYERLTLSAPSAANAIIGTNKGSGGGTARGLDLHTDGSARITITTAGNVGIGTTAPSEKLVVYSNDVNYTGLNVRHGVSGGNFLFAATGTTHPFPNGFGFYDNNAAAYRMFISSAGNVGIGTTAPLTKLDVNGDTRAGGFLYVDRTGSSLGSYFQIRARGLSETSNFGNPIGNGAGEISSFNLSGLVIGNLNATPLVFGTSNLERVRILSTGEVGIGTTSPTSKLQVTNGDVEIETVTSGIIMKAAGTSTRYRITLNATGDALVFTAI